MQKKKRVSPESGGGVGLALVQSRLKKHGCKRSGDDWTCPSHEDKNPSLTVKAGDSAPVIIACPKCHSDDVLKAIGLTWAEVLGGPVKVVNRFEYLYTNKAGVVLYRVVRLTKSDGSKSFLQNKAKANGGWEKGLGDAKRVLYGLPGLRKAIKAGHTVHLTEGEKDADALNAYFEEHELQEFASCHSGGAEKWDVKGASTRYLKHLRGAAQVVIWADRDTAGYLDALERFASVSGAGLPVSLRLPIPTAPKSDVFDHLASGNKPKDGTRVSESALHDLVGEVVDQAYEDSVNKRVLDLRINEDARRRHQSDLIADRASRSQKARSVSGSEFFLDLPDEPPVLWGDGKDILWIDGEPLMVVGDDGTGKSTIDHQIIAARLGIVDEVLGFSVAPAVGTVVYLAMDRPEQARRAGHRLFPEDIDVDFRSQLENLAVWNGPLPFDPLSSPETLADWLRSEFGAVSEVHADSIKDLAGNLSDDGTGSRLNMAIQEVVGRGINWLGLHHQRKANGENKTPDSLADVYGSRWLTAGHGSVLMLSRSKGDKDYIELTQVKEPADRIKPLTLRHDRDRGRTHRVQSVLDVETALLQASDGGATMREIEVCMYPDQEGSDAVRKKIERQLMAKVNAGEVRKIEGSKGGAGGSQASRYLLVEDDDR